MCKLLIQRLAFVAIIATAFWATASNAAPAEVIAAWSDRLLNTYGVYTSQKNEDEWSTPTLVTQSNNRILSVAVGSNSAMQDLNSDSTNAKTLAVWTEVVDQQWLLKFADLIDGKWTSASNLTTLGGENLSPMIIHDLAGNTWVFWSSNVRGNDDIYVKRRVNGQWSNAHIVNEENEVPDILPLAFLDKDGNIVVAWKSLDENSLSYTSQEKVYSFNVEGKPNLNKKLEEERTEFSPTDLPIEVSSSIRVNLHFPKNYHDQSVYIQPNSLIPAPQQSAQMSN